MGEEAVLATSAYFSAQTKRWGGVVVQNNGGIGGKTPCRTLYPAMHLEMWTKATVERVPPFFTIDFWTPASLSVPRYKEKPSRATSLLLRAACSMELFSRTATRSHKTCDIGTPFSFVLIPIPSPKILKGFTKCTPPPLSLFAAAFVGLLLLRLNEVLDRCRRPPHRPRRRSPNRRPHTRFPPP